MELLKLVIVDDEPILLQGLLKTYDWNKMGFEVVGSAQSGEQAIRVIQEARPHVVLTDIRMKQVTGLMVMEEIQKMGIDCLFIILSAYRDFEYAQQACNLGAFDYLLKPIEDEKLQTAMEHAYQTCIEKIQSMEKYSSWEKLMMTDSTNFLQVVVQKYLQNRISYEKLEEVFATLDNVVAEGDRFITISVDVDLTYKITNSLEYEAARFALLRHLEEEIGRTYFYWQFDSEDGYHVFVIKTQENAVVRAMKEILEQARKERKCPIVAAISKPYMGMEGIKRSFEEAQKLFGVASASGASAFTMPDEMEEKAGKPYSSDIEIMIVNAVRKNAGADLKAAFVEFIYALPQEEELQCQYIHKVMLKTELMLEDSYGMTEELRGQFQNYYSNLSRMCSATLWRISSRIYKSHIWFCDFLAEPYILKGIY